MHQDPPPCGQALSYAPSLTSISVAVASALPLDPGPLLGGGPRTESEPVVTKPSIVNSVETKLRKYVRKKNARKSVAYPTRDLAVRPPSPKYQQPGPTLGKKVSLCDPQMMGNLESCCLSDPPGEKMHVLWCTVFSFEHHLLFQDGIICGKLSTLIFKISLNPYTPTIKKIQM